MTGRVPADDVLNNAVGDNSFSLKSTYFGLPEERLSSGLQGTMEVVFAPALSSMALAQNSVLANQPDQVARCLESVAARIVKCAHVFDAMTPRDTANFDPVVWIKTYPAMGRAVTSGELGNSGVDAPLFHALDVFIGRQQVKGDLRGMQSDRRATLPTNIRAFLDALGDDAGSVRDYVAAARAQLNHVPSEEQAQYKHLSAAWDGLLQLYVWFLERHRVKAVGITGVTLNTGRHSTSSGVKSGDQDKAMKDGKPKMRPEAMLSMQMKKGMVSRLGGRPLWQDAYVQSHSVYRGSVVVAVKLDATLPLEPGDRVQVWPPRKRKTLNRASSHHRRLRGSPCPEDHDTSSGESDNDGEPRFYSIARVIPNVSGTAMNSVGGAGAMTIILTVAQHSPEGLVSSFLSSAAPGTHLRLRPWPSPRFRQPRDLTVPLVLVGQGVGIGPLVGFLHDRATKKQRLDDTQNKSAGEAELLLVVAAKTLRHVPCSLDSLEELTSTLPLTIVLALSQETHLKIRGGIWTKLPQGGRRVTRHLTDYRDFIQQLVKEKKATTERGKQMTTAKLIKALVRMQNALTNNTAFDAGRGSVPTYAYEDSLLVFADGLDGIICSLSDFGNDKIASELRETISNTQASLRNAFKALKDGSKRFLRAAGTKGSSVSSSTRLAESEALIQRLHRKPIEKLQAAMNACKKGISEAEVGMNADSSAKVCDACYDENGDALKRVLEGFCISLTSVAKDLLTSPRWPSMSSDPPSLNKRPSAERKISAQRNLRCQA
ncbi:Cytochrome b5-like reductase apf12 [Colletotrichum sp. SAR11_59]|nr:Cytochrome b5-like reductase apf12 [Colletotrichum sp. SAR11_59]